METAENLITKAFDTLAQTAAANEKPLVFKCDDISPSAVIVALARGAGFGGSAGGRGGAGGRGATGASGAAFFVRVDGGALRLGSSLSSLQRRIVGLGGRQNGAGAGNGAILSGAARGEK